MEKHGMIILIACNMANLKYLFNKLVQFNLKEQQLSLEFLQNVPKKWCVIYCWILKMPLKLGICIVSSFYACTTYTHRLAYWVMKLLTFKILGLCFAFIIFRV